MKSQLCARAFALVAVFGIVFSTPVFAQVLRGGVNGTVKDESGGALPGVTVTLTSPALQVPNIVRVTGAEGEYQFVDLPIGSYRLEFVLPGFQTLIRERISLTAGFTARVDASLNVGGLEESITVVGASPLVDTTATRGGTTVSRAQLEELPTSRTYQDIITLTPGMVGTRSSITVGEIGFGVLLGAHRVYGLSGAAETYVDGVNVQNNTIPDFASAEEVDVKTFGHSADVQSPGSHINLVTKSGSNVFQGRVREQFIHNRLGGWSNLDDELRAQGITTTSEMLYAHEFTGDLGGRLIRDKLWFYGATRHMSNERTLPGYSKDPGPDGIYGTSDDTPGKPPASHLDATLNVSYQANPSNRFTGLYSRSFAHEQEAQIDRFRPYEYSIALKYHNYRAKVEWQGSRDRVVANLMAASGWYTAAYATPESSWNLVTRLDRETQINTGQSFDSRANINRPRTNNQVVGNLSYFAGRHELKAGFTAWFEERGVEQRDLESGNYQLVYDRVGGVPRQPVEINVKNAPVDGKERLNTSAAHVNDTWRLTDRVTLNLGLRIDRSVAYVEEQTKVQGQFGGAGTFPRVDVGTWTNPAPRLGVAFDVGGDGKSVLKGTYGRYNTTLGDGFAARYNQNSITITTYRWRDPDGNDDYTPGEVDLDPNGPHFLRVSGATNNEVNPDLRRPYVHEITAAFERELSDGLAMRALYVFNRTRDSIQIVNVLRPYSAYNIQLTRRDPGQDGILDTADDGGALTIYDYDPAFRGAQFVKNQRVNTPGDRDNSAQSFELLLNKRRTGRWFASTAFLATKNHRWIQAIPNSPNDDYFPLDETWDMSYRVSGSYQGPYGIQMSGVYNVQSGVPSQRTNLFRSVDPDGGPPLSQSGTVTLRMEPFGEQRGPLLSNLNLRAGKRFSTGGSSNVEVGVEVFNVFNSNEAWTVSDASGPTFGYATTLTRPRTLRLGLTYQF